MELLNHKCVNCNKTSNKVIVNGYIECSFCNVKNDVWISKFSKPYLRHLLKNFTMVTKKSWKEFQQTGLLFFSNQFLQIFGWSIVFEYDNEQNLIDIYPARNKFRGFGTQSQTEAHKKLSKYVLENAEELNKEANE